MDFWTNLKIKAKKIYDWLERDPNHARLIAWRNYFSKVLVYIDRHLFRIAAVAVLVTLAYSAMYFSFWGPPSAFPNQALITVERGESLSQIATDLKSNGVIKSSFWLKGFIFLLGGEKKVIAGDYYFPTQVSVFKVAGMLHKGEFGLIALKIMIPEGTSSYEMAEIFEKELPAFNPKDFLSEVEKNNYEGFLFPDTYFFTPNTKSSEVIYTMRENFARQAQPFEEDIAKLKKSLIDIVNVASIVEDEADGTLESKRIVAGIIWRRLRMDMPLQVDAPFKYLDGKGTFDLSKEDLADAKNPYNTYANKGLPPTAITNPGIDSLRAAIAPTNTDYLYFLSDKKGNMHYARNFEEHKRNRELYLN